MSLPSEFDRFLGWFQEYCSSYRTGNPDDQRNFDLKELHTLKVLEGIRLIAAGGGARRSFLAELTALCHDLGRFPQYRTYRTFRDSDSVNHAHLSARIVSESGLLRDLPADEAKSILTAVRLHNVLTMPDGLDPQTDDLLRLVRDADKLDIWRVFIDYYEAPDSEKASAAGLGLPNDPFCTPGVVADLAAGKIVRLTTLKTLHDFKLLQISWLYDINFNATLALVRERGIVEALTSTLPEDETVSDALARVLRYVDGRLGPSVSGSG